MSIAVIAIGRNEGDRLIACLDALQQSSVQPTRIIYVDSGSTDNSVAEAKARGAEVVLLDTSIPFTAARARNAGREALRSAPLPDYIQFIDGDCSIDPTWLQKARDFLQNHPQAAVVCGRRRERFPDASVYNRLCDIEWDTPIGKAKACGGDALMRTTALEEVGGYNPSLIAGEEPEMCVRMRAKGWEIWRIDAEMTLHDAAMTRFAQYWKRIRRSGHAYAEGAFMHGTAPEQHGVKGRNSALFWGLGLPGLTVLTTMTIGFWGLLPLLLYPLQVGRLAAKKGFTRTAWEWASFLVVGKFAEAQGATGYTFGRLAGRRATLIEYK